MWPPRPRNTDSADSYGAVGTCGVTTAPLAGGFVAFTSASLSAAAFRIRPLELGMPTGTGRVPIRELDRIAGRTR